MATEKVETLVDGGEASAGPPLGPTLAPLGINIKELVSDINDKTEDFKGMKVPVTIEVDTEEKTWDIEVGTPPSSQLIMKEADVEKGSQEPGEDIVGDVSLENIVSIAESKKGDLLAKGTKAAANTLIGACLSMGITIDGKDPREVQEEMREGEHEDLFESE